MSGEFKIFERMLSGRDPNDKTFLSLSSDTECPLSLVMPHDVNISEAFTMGSPVIVVTFIDANGSLLSYRKLDYDNTFYLSFGKTLTNSVTTIPLGISSMKYSTESSKVTTAQFVSYRVTFIAKAWNELMNITPCRAWEKVRLSDVATEIVKECGYVPEIETSSDIEDTIIQPYFNNIQMLRYLHSHMKGEKYDDIMEFGATIDGRFIFKSLSQLISEQKNDIMKGNIPSLTLKPQNVSSLDRDRDTKDNLGVPDYFLTLDGDEDYSNTTIGGGGGVTYSYYDFDLGEQVKGSVGYADCNSYMLSDNSSLKTVHQENSLFMTGGRDIKTKDHAKLTVTNANNSYNQIGINMEGTHLLNIGDVIEILVPSAEPILTKAVYSDMYSGFYVISSVTHKFRMGNAGSYITRVLLTRQGFDGKELSGFESSSLGKFTGS